ncbi:MAG: winged helix-turn-helix transcriptional regulator [Rhodospirillales bacterium]|jgi:DNA-binding MarR family transcriptional regulator|nr:winged helix-turn-helix transcriptional regulator [Rhodospirillales bacterium]
MSKRFHPDHTPEGSALTSLMLEIFRVNGALLEAGDALTREIGLTSARWQVLGAVAMAVEPRPVAYLARSMGLARQSVQRVVDDLMAEGFLAQAPNPHHKRAWLILLTDKGRRAYDAAIDCEVPWANRLAQGLTETQIETALAVLKQLRKELAMQGEPV